MDKIDVWLKEEEILFRRDEKGSLLPVEVQIKSLPKAGGTEYRRAKITPMSRGELLRILGVIGTTKKEETDADLEIVKNHLIEPKLDRVALEHGLIRHEYVRAIAASIIALSLGKEEEEKPTVEKAENEFQKKSVD